MSSFNTCFTLVFFFSSVLSDVIELDWGLSVGNQGKTTAYPNDIIRWIWIDNAEHTVTCDVDSNYCNFPDSGELSGPNQQYEWQLGSFHSVNYSYHCEVHPSMKGIIDVIEGTRAPSLPQPTMSPVPTMSPTEDSKSYYLLQISSIIWIVSLVLLFVNV